MLLDYEHKIELSQKYPHIYELLLEYYTVLASNEAKKCNPCSLIPIIEKILENKEATNYCKENDKNFYQTYIQHQNGQKIFVRMFYYDSFASSLLMYYYH